MTAEIVPDNVRCACCEYFTNFMYSVLCDSISVGMAAVVDVTIFALQSVALEYDGI